MLSTAAVITSGLLGAIVFALLFSDRLTKSIDFLVLISGGVFGILAGVGLRVVIMFLARDNVGSFDGKYFHFTNPEFHRQFVALNPSLIEEATSS
jgi:hypothetical protein